MKRRTFIENSLLMGLPFALLTPSLLASCKADDFTSGSGKAVIIVGAGISGLAAAKKLKEKGFTVIVIEAQEKLGGRLRTDRSLGVAFDEGASWVHGPNGNPITDLASQSGANTFITDDNNVAVFDANGIAYSESNLTRSEEDFDDALAAVRRMGTQTQSFETVFNSLYPSQANNRLWKYMLSAFTEFDYGGDIAELSSKYFDDDKAFEGLDIIVTNGFDKVANFLADGLDVRLNTRVSEINYSGNKVNVTSNNQTFEADYVVVTIPLGVLKNKSVAFVPSLPPAKTTAINNLKMGNINKFLLTWDDAFWDTSLQYIGYTPEEKGKFNYFLNVKKFNPNTNALMTFAFGNYATQTEAMTDAQVITEIMTHLKAIYGNSIPNPTSILRTKWRQNENSFGSYSFATNGTSTADFDELENEVNDKLFFAGEHTERNYRGTVHGAYLSGIREADKIIGLL